MQDVTARVETETKHAAPYWTERHGFEGVDGALPVEGDTYQGETAHVEAGAVRVSVSPEYDGVWVWVREPGGLEIRVQVRSDGTVEVEDTRGGVRFVAGR